MKTIDQQMEEFAKLIKEVQIESSLQVLADLEKVMGGKIRVHSIDDFESELFNVGVKAAISIVKLYRESICPAQSIKPQKVEDENYEEF